jgi:hypothetical protein
MAATLSELRVAVHGWHVHGGELWVELDDRGVRVACACGRGHFLLTEDLRNHALHVHCHACGKGAELRLEAAPPA